MFVACGIWCLADVSSVGPSSEQTQNIRTYPRLRKGKELTFYSLDTV